MRARSDERRNECVTEHDLLLKDKALAKKLGLYPLPPWADFCELEAVKKLWQIATIDDAYAEEYPSIVTDAGAIADELSTLKTVFKAALLPKVVEILRDIEKASASTEGAHRLELLPEPEDGDDFTLEQEDDILARASSAISCRACSFIDVFPRILAHECASYSSRHGAASHTIAEYKVREKVARAVLAIADKAGLEPEASYDAFDELGSTMSCACDLPEPMAVPWHNMVRSARFSALPCQTDAKVPPVHSFTTSPRSTTRPFAPPTFRSSSSPSRKQWRGSSSAPSFPTQYRRQPRD